MDKVSLFLTFVKGALRQPSTKAGILMVSGLVGLHIVPEAYDAAVQTVMAAVGLYEVVRQEHLPS